MMPTHCPECGHHDKLCWRNLRWTLNQDYAHIEEIESLDPELGKVLKEKKPTHSLPLQIGIYIYFMTPTNYVRRMWVEDYLTYGFNHRQTESDLYKERIRLGKAQQKLTRRKGWIG